MSAASELFTSEEREAIARAVAAAESATSAEIIPAVASASGRYDRAEDVFGLLLGVLAMVAVWLTFQDTHVADGWAGEAAPRIGLIAIIVTLLAGFAAGVVLASRFPVLRLPFIPANEMRQEVERAAGEAFYRLRLRGTAGGTGVLIYISLYERMVRVVGDDAIAQKLGQPDWDAVCDLARGGLRDGRACAGLVAAIEHCGSLCAPHFPRRTDDADELDNTLRVLD